MPMDPAYEELEKDIVEKHGGGRAWQEMAKNPALPGSGVLAPFPKGTPRQLIEHRKKKTKKVVNAEITQVLRKKPEG